MLLKLPNEVIERCLLYAALRDIASAASVNRALYALVYHSSDQHLWRSLYLLQFDDPRPSRAVEHDHPEVRQLPARPRFDWQHEVQRRERARLVLMNPCCEVILAQMTETDRRDVFEALVAIVRSVAPLDYQDADMSPLSKNTRWIHTVFRATLGGHFGHPAVMDCAIPSPPTTPDFLACFHFQTLVGLQDYLTRLDRRRILRAARLYVFADENCCVYPKEWGPFLETGAINWRAIFSSMALIWFNCTDPELRPPYGVESVRPAINVSADLSHDWAGVEGVWMFYVCVPDPNDITAYNSPSPAEPKCPRNPQVFESPAYNEAITATDFVVRLTSVDCIPELSDWPVLRFSGIGHVQLLITGYVHRARDGTIQWTIHTSTTNDVEHWLSKGVQIGGPKSEAGFIGQWCQGRPRRTNLGEPTVSFSSTR
ncbi:hypothetical protein AURDEDRAFT_160323 [Auricularia subglabra TFB-10046 SS5]|nr:hypothetical protein AURDEDRAFT_160323 [Auricularia subglabra TFB-10046 SS5]